MKWSFVIDETIRCDFLQIDTEPFPASGLRSLLKSKAHWEGCRMLYVVEIPVSADRLADELSQMRTWLDHMHYQPVGFRHSSVAKTAVCRIDFTVEGDAKAFARAFGGRLYAGTSPAGLRLAA
jgi:hypothetical protein